MLLNIVNVNFDVNIINNHLVSFFYDININSWKRKAGLGNANKNYIRVYLASWHVEINEICLLILARNRNLFLCNLKYLFKYYSHEIVSMLAILK